MPSEGESIKNNTAFLELVPEVSTGKQDSGVVVFSCSSVLLHLCTAGLMWIYIAITEVAAFTAVLFYTVGLHVFTLCQSNPSINVFIDFSDLKFMLCSCQLAEKSQPQMVITSILLIGFYFTALLFDYSNVSNMMCTDVSRHSF